MTPLTSFGSRYTNYLTLVLVSLAATYFYCRPPYCLIPSGRLVTMARNARFGPLEPVQIFQDGFYDQATPIMSHAPMPPTSAAPRRALQPSNRNVIFNPPNHNMSAVRQSPFKPALQGGTPLAPLKASQTNIGAVSIIPPCAQRAPTDSLPKKQPVMSRFKTVAQKPAFAGTSAAAPGHLGKENYQGSMMYPVPPPLNLSIDSFYQKPSGKRLLEAPPIKDSRPQKKPRLDGGPLPPHDSFPLIVDDGTKPGHSYAMLIGMAILRSPQRRLTLSQIYKWISDNFSFYSPNDAGWQNSIRHNLSLNKNFIKHERPKDDPGKGNYWAIEPGMEHLFMKEKLARKSISASDNVSVMSTVLEPSLPPPPSSSEPVLPTQLASAATPIVPNAPSTAIPTPLEQEPSSDATIPVSDSGAADEALDTTIAVATTEPLTDANGYSPLAAAMHSSPPIPRHLEPRRNTPPPPLTSHHRESSAAKSHKRKFASMDDSGYISSLESSVLRSNQNGRLLTSEADRPRIKRGRAEEEIARLRASSYESPSKGRSWSGFMPQSSSPLRQTSGHDAGQMLPPLTPAVKLAPPPRPPPSVSPNTNLRLHRAKVQRMVDSPLRRVLDMPEQENGWGTPGGYQFDPSVYDFSFGVDTSGVAEFDIFQDSTMPSIFPSVEDGSPVKRSLKRPRLERPSSTGVLGEITNSGSRRPLASAPLLKATRSPATTLDTPSKALAGGLLPSSPSKVFLQSPAKLPDMAADAENTWLNIDDFCSTTTFLEEAGDFPGVDITQGFDKIGQPSRSSKSGKPGLGRSYTTSF
ncbi:hypothetical protein RB597_002413 [Gaeumannomyces tritici]